MCMKIEEELYCALISKREKVNCHWRLITSKFCGFRFRQERATGVIDDRQYGVKLSHMIYPSYGLPDLVADSTPRCAKSCQEDLEKMLSSGSAFRCSKV